MQLTSQNTAREGTSHEISHQDRNLILAQTAQQEEANSRLTRGGGLVTIQTKNPTMANRGKRSKCLCTYLLKLWEWHPCPVETWSLDSIRWYPRKTTPGPPALGRPGWKGPVGCHRNPHGGDIFWLSSPSLYLPVSVSFSPLSLPPFLSLSLPSK